MYLLHSSVAVLVYSIYYAATAIENEQSLRDIVFFGIL